VTEFVSFDLPLQPIAELQRSILAALEARGQPLRWAITAVEGGGNGKGGWVSVEAVVLT
jgi:hypothetical protein